MQEKWRIRRNNAVVVFVILGLTLLSALMGHRVNPAPTCPTVPECNRGQLIDYGFLPDGEYQSLHSGSNTFRQNGEPDVLVIFTMVARRNLAHQGELYWPITDPLHELYFVTNLPPELSEEGTRFSVKRPTL